MTTSTTGRGNAHARPISRATEEAAYQQLVTATRSTRGGVLFTTDATNLYEKFLAALPASRRQRYQCRTCRRFVDRFGGLVTIDANGETHPLLWGHEADSGFFVDALQMLRHEVRRASVTGVFLSSEELWGVDSNTARKTGVEWHHLHIQPSKEMIRRGSPLKTDDQAAAEKLEDRAILCRSFTEFPIEVVRQAHSLLTTGALYRSEKCIGVVGWLLDLYEARATTKHKQRRENLVWRAVAMAPPGFCHVRTTMIGTLLEDLVAGKLFGDVKRSFDSKMAPTQYQRPQAAPTDGQLAAAETLVAKLASAGALARRFATLEDVRAYAIWTPKPTKPIESSGDVFGHLRSDAKLAQTIDVPPQPMTWDKFNWTVLPKAERVELLVPRVHAPFFAFVTATNPNAPPILQWDSEEKRNPVSWYLHASGSLAHEWGVPAGEFCEVAAITLQPSGWNGGHEHQGDGAYFILHGARELCADGVDLGLFPEILKAEYRGIRAAIEALSRSRALDGQAQASACGIALQKGNTWNQVVRVTTSGVRTLYRLERWD